MVNHSLEQFIEDYLGKQFDHYGTICFTNQNGVQSFYQWLKSDDWKVYLPLSDLEISRYTPVIICYSFRAIRYRMNKSGLFSLRKKKLETALQDLMRGFDEAKLHEIITGERQWAEFFHRTINAIQREYHCSLPIWKEKKDVTSLETEVWFDEWLVRPHFPKYKAYFEVLPKEVQDSFAEKSVEVLRKQTHHPHVRRVYFQVLLFHEKYDAGLQEMLERVVDPLQLTPEEDIFITALIDSYVDGAFVLFHQFTERLIERKSKSHYKQAVKYIDILFTLYDQQQTKEQFYEYMNLLKRKYERYSSFQKELSNCVHYK